MQKVYTMQDLSNIEQGNSFIIITKEGKKHLMRNGVKYSLHLPSTIQMLLAIDQEIGEYEEKLLYIDVEKGIGAIEKEDLFENYMKGKSFRLLVPGKYSKTFIGIPSNFSETHIEMTSDKLPVIEVKYGWVKIGDTKIHSNDPTDKDFEEMEKDLAKFGP